MISYAVTVGATFGAAMTLITWRKTRMLRRLRLAPVSTCDRGHLRVVVSLLIALFQLALLLGVSMLPFLGLQLNGAWYMAIPLVMAGTLAFLAIGLFVGAVVQDRRGRLRPGQPDHPADGVPVRRVHPARPPRRPG